MKSKKDIIMTIIFIIMTIIFSISAAIIIPIIFRPFYYASIKILDIEGKSGYSYNEIKKAFDGVMDFIWCGKPFNVGDLKYTHEGMLHFKDCIFLFWLDLIAFLVSFSYIITHFVLVKKKIINFYNFFGFHPFFYSGIVTIFLVVFLIIAISIDFERAFEIFHKMFFPGKENWVFDPDEDEVIKILPIEFFALCGAWIGGHVLLFDLSGITYGAIYRIRQRKMKKGDNDEGTICN